MPAALKRKTNGPNPRNGRAAVARPSTNGGLHGRPAGILSAAERGVAAKLQSRLAETGAGHWLTVEEFRRKAALQ